jgi:hypothetical protein
MPYEPGQELMNINYNTPGNMLQVIANSTPQQQANNRHTNVFVEHDGHVLTLADWARKLGLPYHWLRYRHSIGWVPPQLFSPENHKGEATVYTVQYQGKEVTMKELSVLTGTNLQTLYARIYAGKPLIQGEVK